MSAEPIADLGLGHVRLPCWADLGATPLGSEYGPAAGLPPLRQAIAAWEGVAPEEVAVTTGASLALVAALCGLERPGAVLCPRPYYPAYARVLEALGLEPLFYELRRELGWLPEPGALARLLRPDARAVLWNFPGNPAGSLPTEQLLAELREVVARAGLLLVSDEVYADLLPAGERFADIRDHVGRERTVRLRSFSKVFGMAGERLGYAVAAPWQLAALSGAHWALAMSPPATAQAIALARLQADPARRLAQLRCELDALRRETAEILAASDRLRFTMPAAGIFHWIEVRDCPLGSRELARACAAEAGVVVMPGAAFGIEEPVCLRASFALARPQAVRGFAALAAFLDRLERKRP
jgi:aspartate/methionine/tyrosine aminotransferase